MPLRDSIASRNPASRCCVLSDPFGVAQQHDFAGVVQRAREMLAREPAALAVVGRHEADVVAALQAGVDDDDGNAAPLGVGHRRGERRFVERREHDAGHAAADEAFDLRHLRVAIVLAQRPAPDDRRRPVPAPPSPRRRGCSARRRATCPSG